MIDAARIREVLERHRNGLSRPSKELLSRINNLGAEIDALLRDLDAQGLAPAGWRGFDVERLAKMLRPSWFEYVYVDEATGEECHGLNNYPGQHKQMQQRAREEAREFLASLAAVPASPARVEQAAWWCCDTSCEGEPRDKPCANCIDRVNAILEIVSGEQPIQPAAPASPSPTPLAPETPWMRQISPTRWEPNHVATLHAPTAWRCFHCDEVFTDAECAKKHFGEYEDCLPACKIGAEQFRKMESELQCWCSQNDPATKEFYSLGADHDRKVRRAEQEGYDKGLADGCASDTASHAPTVEALQTIRDALAYARLTFKDHNEPLDRIEKAQAVLRALTSGAEAGERPPSIVDKTDTWDEEHIKRRSIIQTPEGFKAVDRETTRPLSEWSDDELFRASEGWPGELAMRTACGDELRSRGWLPWCGSLDDGDAPVKGRVEVRLRSGTHRTEDAETLRWGRYFNLRPTGAQSVADVPSDIIAYRPAPSEEQVERAALERIVEKWTAGGRHVSNEKSDCSICRILGELRAILASAEARPGERP